MFLLIRNTLRTTVEIAETNSWKKDKRDLSKIIPINYCKEEKELININ